MDAVRSRTLHADRSRQDHRGLPEEHPQPWVGAVMRRTGSFGLLGVPLILLLGSLTPTLVWAASLARDPVQVLKSGATVTLYGVVFASPTAGWVVGGAGTILATTNVAGSPARTGPFSRRTTAGPRGRTSPPAAKSTSTPSCFSTRRTAGRSEPWGPFCRPKTADVRGRSARAARPAPCSTSRFPIPRSDGSPVTAGSSSRP